jgi:HSP20 family molecular chaperone IbpA
MSSPTQTTSQELELRAKQALQQEATRPGPIFRPDADILERSDAYVIYADLPGADEKTVQVRLERGQLQLDAELATRPDPGWSPLHAEYRIGGYHREFLISDEIDPDGVSASMRDGVLELILPKSRASRRRTIDVRSG